MASSKKPEESGHDFTREVSEAFSGQLWAGLKKSEALSKKYLEEESFLKDHKRSEFKKSGWFIFEITFFGFVFFSLLTVGFSFVFHLLTPWAWLNDDQLNRVEAILFSVLTTNALSPWFKDYFNKITQTKTNRPKG